MSELVPEAFHMKKNELLVFSYAEVLDATKHQDDKIGRFLTAIAFLFAGSFALANLDSSKWLIAQFEFDPGEKLRLATVFLWIFLAGLIFTTVLLMSSFSTPLRFPNIEASKKKIQNSSKGKKSRIYFNEIALTSLDEWRKSWSIDLHLINQEYENSLINEIHNLSLRSKTKYGRMTEAVSIFSFALLSYLLAISCVLIASLNPHSLRIEKHPQFFFINSTVRSLFGIIFLLYSLLQVHGTHQGHNQAIDDRKQHKVSNIFFYIFSSIYLVTIGSLSFIQKGAAWNLFLIEILVVLSIVYGATWGISINKRHQSSQSKELSTRLRWTFTILRIFHLLVVLFLIIVSIGELRKHNSFENRFFVTFGLIGVMVFWSGLQPYVTSWSEKTRFKDRERQSPVGKTPML